MGIELEADRIARAEDCCSAGLSGGEPAVWYRGEAYFVIGFFFARKHGGDRELHYFLRTCQAHGNGLYPLSATLNRAVS